MTQAPPQPAGARALQLIRAAYGTALVLVPGPVIQLATGRVPGRRACQVARVLGARHLAQTALTAVAARPSAFAAGAGVDALHASSMLLLAAADNSVRRAALADALAESALAAGGFSVSTQRV
jgi:hypothetical protein